MVNENVWFYWRDKWLFIHIYLQPRASKDQIIGIHDDCLKIRLSAPPIEGEANQALIKFIANCFQVPASRVIITQGIQSRKKWVKIDNPLDLSILNENRISK